TNQRRPINIDADHIFISLAARHEDVKPANLPLDSSRCVRQANFGDRKSNRARVVVVHADLKPANTLLALMGCGRTAVWQVRKQVPYVYGASKLKDSEVGFRASITGAPAGSFLQLPFLQILKQRRLT
uniref:Uncharacterized protein n=1 Tax=Aegilops tauschii subsp. strangulata TaxID=200361 RepID=A0A453APY4_AEGTS